MSRGQGFEPRSRLIEVRFSVNVCAVTSKLPDVDILLYICHTLALEARELSHGSKDVGMAAAVGEYYGSINAVKQTPK